MSPKEQLAYLSQVLGFTVTYNDFPKKGEYLSLVSLSTNPAQVRNLKNQNDLLTDLLTKTMQLSKSKNFPSLVVSG